MQELRTSAHLALPFALTKNRLESRLSLSSVGTQASPRVSQTFDDLEKPKPLFFHYQVRDHGLNQLLHGAPQLGLKENGKLSYQCMQARQKSSSSSESFKK